MTPSHQSKQRSSWRLAWTLLLVALLAAASSHSPQIAAHAAPPAELPAIPQATYEVCKAVNCTYKTIESALVVAQLDPNPDIIIVDAGTFPEAPLVISDVITITSNVVDFPVIQPARNMRNEAWISVLPGARLTMQNLVLDGLAQGMLSVKVGVAVSGELHVDHVVFRNLDTLNTYTNGVHSIALLLSAAPGSAPSSVNNSSFENIDSVGVLACGDHTALVFENNTYTGKDSATELDLGVWVSGGAQANLQGNDIQHNRGIIGLLQSAAVRVDASNEMCLQGNQPSSVVLTGNTLLDSQVGVWVGNGPSDGSYVEAHFNRIAANGHGLYFNAATGPDLSATNNWWGCSAGPGSPGCNTAFFLPETYYNPWLTMHLQAAPDRLIYYELGAYSDISVDLRYNSDGLNTGSLGSLPDGTPLVFTATLGTVTPEITGTLSAQASTVFTPGGEQGFGGVSATLDGERQVVLIMLQGQLTYLPQIYQEYPLDLIP